jgi:hypothetical protein
MTSILPYRIPAGFAVSLQAMTQFLTGNAR